MNNRHIKITIFIGLSIIHLLIGLSFFEAFGDGSELATSLIRIGRKLKLILLAFLFPAIILLIYSYINKDITKASRGQILILFLLSIISFVSFYLIANYTAFPKMYLSQDEYLKKQLKKDKELKNRVNRVLKKANLFIASDIIYAKDKQELEKIVRKEWDSFYSPLMRKRPEYEPLIARINRLLNCNYDFVEKDSIIELRKRTTETDFILYSPGFQYFIGILTYEMSKNPAEKYGYITLLGQKLENRIYSYAFTGDIQGGYGSSPTREGAVNEGLLDAFFYPGRDMAGNNYFGFGRELLKLKPNENPPSLDFWISGGVKNLFQYKRDTIIPYKYSTGKYSKDSISANYYIWVYEN